MTHEPPEEDDERKIGLGALVEREFGGDASLIVFLALYAFA